MRSSDLRIAASSLTLAFVTTSAVATGCASRRAGLETLTVGQLAALLKSADPPRLYDANGDSTRHEYGAIPTATLLPSSGSYSLSLLPEQKAAPLVFYCASTWCGAAETAARRAVVAGYKAVKVLPDGIRGWTEAGMPTTKVN